jgi:hypothetical protein
MKDETFFSLVPGSRSLYFEKLKHAHADSDQTAVRRVLPGVLHNDDKVWMISLDFRLVIVKALSKSERAHLGRNGKPPEQEVSKHLSNFIFEEWLRAWKGAMEELIGWQGKQDKAVGW